MPDPALIIKQAFRGITDDEVVALCKEVQMLTYPANHTLCHEGEIEHVFYILAEGQVAITQRVGATDERTIAQLGPGDFFGEMGLIETKPRAASITTRELSTVLEITEDVFNEFLGHSTNVAMAMIRRITSNLRSSDQASIQDLSRKNIELKKAYDELKAAQAEVVKKERLERELEIAGEVQRSLLPTKFPKVPGYSFAGRNVPARHVGGDLYDVIKIDDEHMGLLMADVSDKGVHAALIMAVTRTLFLAHARRSLSPAEVALAVHHGILEVSSNDDMFVTAFYGVLHLSTGHLRYVRAGQDIPLVFHADDEPPSRLEAEGRFLGMLPDLQLEERETYLTPGDVLVAYSDGVSDAVNLNDDLYSLERLVALLSKNRAMSAATLCTSIFNDVFTFRGTAPAFDDITVLVARYDGNK